jgi:hypothetical protein
MPRSQADELTPGYWEQTLLPQTGLATFYASGMMEYVHEYRRAQGQLLDCPECVGTVALLRAGDIGRRVWLQAPGEEKVGPFLVIDCARRQDVDPLLARNWVVDVSYELGQAWGMDRPLDGVTVLEDPADAVPERVLRVPTPFYVPPGQAVVSAPTPTPEFTPSAPTPWPTRVPAGLQPHSTPEALPAVPTLPVPQLAPPLTPVVTTPTPMATATSGPPGESAPVPASTAAPTATEGPVEVSVGRAGRGLLDPSSALTPPPAIWPIPTVTPRPPTRTPRPDLTPILAPGAELPVPTPTPTDELPLIQFWRGLFGRVFP